MRKLLRSINFIALFLVINPLVVKGQDLEQQIYEAFITGEMDLWEDAINQLQTTWEQTGNHGVLYDLVVAQYGYIAFLIADKEKKEARVYVKRAEANLERLLEYRDNWARAHALLGAIYGFKVGLDPYKAVVFGKRSFDENNRAFELAPNDPQVWMEKANIELYKPSIFGSNAPEAVKMYAKAVSLYETSGESDKNWLYLNTLSGLATAQIEAGQLNKANETYRKLLRAEPEFKWIRDEIYPAFRKKHGF